MHNSAVTLQRLSYGPGRDELTSTQVAVSRTTDDTIRKVAAHMTHATDTVSRKRKEDDEELLLLRKLKRRKYLLDEEEEVLRTKFSLNSTPTLEECQTFLKKNHGELCKGGPIPHLHLNYSAKLLQNGSQHRSSLRLHSNMIFLPL